MVPGCRCWSLLKTGMSPEDILMEEEAMLQVCSDLLSTR